MITTNPTNNTTRLQRAYDTVLDLLDDLRDRVKKGVRLSTAAELAIVLIVAIAAGWRLLAPAAPPAAGPVQPARVVEAPAQPSRALLEAQAQRRQLIELRATVAALQAQQQAQQVDQAPAQQVEAQVDQAPAQQIEPPAPAPVEVDQVAAPIDQAPALEAQLQATPASYTGATVEYNLRNIAGSDQAPNGATGIEVVIPAGAPQLCTGFGDARDYDPMYAGSPVCHNPAPAP